MVNSWLFGQSFQDTSRKKGPAFRGTRHGRRRLRQLQGHCFILFFFRRLHLRQMGTSPPSFTNTSSPSPDESGFGSLLGPRVAQNHKQRRPDIPSRRRFKREKVEALLPTAFCSGAQSQNMSVGVTVLRWKGSLRRRIPVRCRGRINGKKRKKLRRRHLHMLGRP